MGKSSSIEWTKATFNPWVGCQKVSPGCENCYAERDMTKYPRWANTWGPVGERQRTSEAYWQGPIKWNAEAKAAGKPIMVFAGSLCDIFELVATTQAKDLNDWRLEFFRLVQDTPWLVWQLLTKRPQNVNKLIPAAWDVFGAWPKNVWLGTSVENQDQAKKRIWALLSTGAAVKWISAEPLLGPLNLWPWIAKIDWLVVGGESGPADKRRKMDLTWARNLKDQAVHTKTAYFFKQIDKVKDKAEGIPEDLQIRQFPEKALEAQLAWLERYQL